MLIKLLKYDLKYMLKNMIVFYILSIVFAILTRIFFMYDSIPIMNVIGQITVGCMFSMIASTLINTLMRSWVRFNDSIYKDESYLTHTLPVEKNDIYDSKFIQTLLFYLVGFIVILLSLFIAYYTKDRWILLKDLIINFTKSLNINVSLFIISVILILFLEIFNALQCGYFGLLIGHKKNNNKIGYSVLYGFISYIISQLVVILLLLFIGLFNPTIMNLFKNNIQLDIYTIKLFAITSIFIYVLIIVIMNLICKNIFNKGVNID